MTGGCYGYSTFQFRHSIFTPHFWPPMVVNNKYQLDLHDADPVSKLNKEILSVNPTIVSCHSWFDIS